MSESHDPNQEDAVNKPHSFFTLQNLKVAQVNIIGGTLNGYSIGFVGVYSDIYSKSTQCSLYKSSTSCTTLSNSDCFWNSAVTVDNCQWSGQTMCSTAYTDEATCVADSVCHWNYNDKVCENSYGYSSAYSGIFAGAMILGSLLGSMVAGPIARWLGPKLSFLTIGCICIVGSVMYIISTAFDQFWVLVAARLLVGLVLGLVCVACPMYVAEHASIHYSKMIGVLFQVFTTFGIFLAALVGLALGQSVDYNSDSDQRLQMRLQGLCIVSLFLSVAMAVMGLFFGGFGIGLKRKDASNPYSLKQEDNGNKRRSKKQYSVLSMIPQLFISLVMAGTLQLTGINAVMNYAPTMMKRLGLVSLVGNFVVMLWNFVTTIVSIPLASMLTMRHLFLICSLVTSVACLFLCGVPVYPGVASTDAKNGLAITGILIFIAFFEIGVGPCFYVLSQDLFPQSFRHKGSSFTMVWQFIFNIFINVFYPIVTEDISGGASGNQDKGQAVAFIFFGCIGLVCFIVEIFFLFPWEENEDDESE